MGSIVQIATFETSQNDTAVAMEGINRECYAPTNLMTFYANKLAIRITPPGEKPTSINNQTFFFGATTRLCGWYMMKMEKYFTMKPLMMAEAVFTFGLQEKGAPPIICLRATDHICSPDKNLVVARYLVWKKEVFPDPKDYKQHAIIELVRELDKLATCEITQNVLLAIIMQIDKCERLLR